MKRYSTRIRSKSAANNEKSKEEQEKDSIRFMYAQDMKNCHLAFVRILPDDIISIPNEMRGILHVGSLPESIGKFDWGTVSVFHNEQKICYVDSFGLMNDDKQYRAYIESIPDVKWDDKEAFFKEYMKVGRDVNKLEKNAYKTGRIDGIKEACLMFTEQVLIYLTVKMRQTLTEPMVKRGGLMKSYEHLPLTAFNETGCDLIKTMAASYKKSGKTHFFKNVDWDILAGHVGIEYLAKKISDKLYYYGDVNGFEFNEDSHLLSMAYVGTRWNGGDHRHRNIPLFFNIN